MPDAEEFACPVGALRALEVVAALKLPAAVNVAIAPSFKCTTDCQAWDESCLRPLVQVATGKPKIAAFAGILKQTQTGTIKKSEIMKLFGATTDLCNRGDTILAGGEFLNKGDACNLSLAIDFGDGTTEAFISLPGVVHGRMTATKTGVTVRFDDENVSPGIYTTERNVSQAWGGVVSEVETAADYLYIRTTTACIAVRL